MKTTGRKIERQKRRTELRLFVMIALGLAAGSTHTAMAQDCNSDGIPDSQQLTTPVELRSGNIDHFNNHMYVSRTFQDVPAAIGPVTMTLNGRVIVDDPDKWADFYINGVLIAERLWETDGEYCFFNIDNPATVVIDEASWNSLRDLGEGDMFMEVRYTTSFERCGITWTRFSGDYDASNDCDGDGLLNECETEDCDGNGVFDGCQHDADGDGVINTCDLCSDFDDAFDADGDTIPDACDTCPGTDDLRDCNNDGVADCLQLTRIYRFNTDYPADCPGDPVYYPPLELPRAIGDVTLTYDFPWTENIYDADEWIDVTLNGVPVARVLDSDWNCQQYLHQVITIPAETWNEQLSPAGATGLYLYRNAASCADAGDCPDLGSDAFALWKVEYEYSTDIDGDGWLDACDVCFGNDAFGDADGDGICDAPLGIDWGIGVDGELPGSICNTDVTISPVFDGSQSIGDFSGPNYAYAPLGASQQYAGFGAATNWTATFEPPADDVLLYTYYWRGAGAGGPDPVTYEFDRPFTIVSGMAGASVAGNTLILPTNAFFRGILRFPGPIDSISVVTSATDAGAGQGLTFAMVSSTADSDSDGVIDTCDVCPGFDDSIDADSDGIPDGCDACPDLPNVHNVTQDAYYATI